MDDDIVTRLRKQISNEFVIDHPNMVRVPTLYEQAADEIERLRKEINIVSVLRGALRIIIDNLEDGDVNSAMLVAKFALTVEPKVSDEPNN